MCIPNTADKIPNIMSPIPRAIIILNIMRRMPNCVDFLFFSIKYLS